MIKISKILSDPSVIAFIMAILIVGVLVGISLPSGGGTDSAKSLMHDVCKELSNNSTSQFIRWGGVGSSPTAPEGIHWSINCTTGLESIRGN